MRPTNAKSRSMESCFATCSSRAALADSVDAAMGMWTSRIEPLTHNTVSTVSTVSWNRRFSRGDTADDADANSRRKRGRQAFQAVQMAAQSVLLISGDPL